MLSTGSEQQGQNTRVRTVFLTLTKILDLLVFVHQVCKNTDYILVFSLHIRRDVPVGIPFDLSTPTGMSCIGIYGENCKSDNASKYRVLLVVFLLLWHEN